jgi:uncharacterized coiled-coil protein SlyX
MSEIQAKLSDMRGAAEQIRASGRRVEASVESAAAVLDGLFALGLNNPPLQAKYIAFRGQMGTWTQSLTQFADELTDAADAVEAATRGEGFVFSLGRRPSRDLTLGREAAPMVVESEAGAALHPFGYIAAHNEPLYERWQAQQDALEGREATLAAMVQTRADTAADLTALKNRLHSYDPTVDVDAIPRVAAMETELAALDANIASLQGEITGMQAELDALTERLNYVTAAEGADIALIESMEGTASPVWLGENTFDCVNHVVGKFHVPPDIARDAYLWIEKAGLYPEYGVSVGETPMEGAVLWMDRDHPYADPDYGHVMYVERVTGDAVWVTDNNHPASPVRLDAITDHTEGIRYLYFPWHTVG